MRDQKTSFRDLSLQEGRQFETLLVDISTKFVNISANRIDKEIESMLQRITEVLKIDRCSVAQFSDDKSRLQVTHSYAVPGVAPMPDLILNEQQPWYSHKLYRGETIVMSRLDDLPQQAFVEKEHCIQQGIKSSVLIPLEVGGIFLGVVGFASLTTELEWPAVLVNRLNMLGFVFANALVRKTKEQELLQAFSEIKILKDKLEAENSYLRDEISLQYLHDEFIGQSELFKRTLNKAEQVAKIDTTVLILGETGTGKELLAQTIHKLSSRNKHPMITVNCAALPDNLVESELFGHEKGAFTGADSRRFGRFELANGSTLFLDEIGELSLPLQAKILRVLQERQFERLGGQTTINSDVRIIAATNRDLPKAIQAGEFRMDLFYRLNVFPITIPPLRERQSDIPLLVWFFLRKICKKIGKDIDNISRSSMNKLCNHQWPGNVRELQNTIERAIIISSNNNLQVELPGKNHISRVQARTLDEVQREYITNILESTKWCIRGKNGAAAILGVKPTTLEYRMKKLEIHRPKLITQE